MASTNNVIEIIDLDEDEVNCTSDARPGTEDERMSTQKKIESLGALKSAKLAGKPAQPTSNVPLKKVNSESTFNNSNESTKTIALIPIDYLSYCDVKNGKLSVRLDTLNELSKKGSSVILCKVPEGSALNPNIMNLDQIKTTNQQMINGQSKNSTESMTCQTKKSVAEHSTKNPGKLLIDLRNPPPLIKTGVNNLPFSIPLNKTNTKIKKNNGCNDSIKSRVFSSYSTNIISKSMKQLYKPIEEPLISIDSVDVQKDVVDPLSVREVKINERVYPFSDHLYQKPYIDQEGLTDNGRHFLLEEPKNFTGYEKYSNSSYECRQNDPLEGLPNIFEPIVTLNELNEEHLPFGNPLPKGFKPDHTEIEKLKGELENDNSFSQKKNKRSSKLNISTERRKKSSVRKDASVVIDKTIENVTPSFPKTTSDQCRSLFLKCSAWDKLDLQNQDCKGFNEREIYISEACLNNSSSYLVEGRNHWNKFLNKVGHDDEDQTTVSEFSHADDLYFTKKIDIMDKRGRRIRTEYLDRVEQEKHKKRKFDNYHMGYISRNNRNQVENVKRQKLSGSIEYMLTLTKPCHVVIERSNLVEREIKVLFRKDKQTISFDTKFSGCRALRKDSFKPMLILNKNNICSVKLDHVTCSRSNVVFVKKAEEDFPEEMSKNENLVKLINKNLIKITSPKVLQSYFALEDVK